VSFETPSAVEKSGFENKSDFSTVRAEKFGRKSIRSQIEVAFLTAKLPKGKSQVARPDKIRLVAAEDRRINPPINESEEFVARRSSTAGEPPGSVRWTPTLLHTVRPEPGTWAQPRRRSPPREGMRTIDQASALGGKMKVERFSIPSARPNFVQSQWAETDPASRRDADFAEIWRSVYGPQRRVPSV